MPELHSIRFDPPSPIAGTEFYVIVTLDSDATNDLVLPFEKQRVKIHQGGFPELRPTGPKYFALDPSPIVISVGQREGSSKLAVRPDAVDVENNKPIRFPDNLVLTYFGPFIPPGASDRSFLIGVVAVQGKSSESRAI